MIYDFTICLLATDKSNKEDLKIDSIIHSIVLQDKNVQFCQERSIHCDFSFM